MGPFPSIGWPNGFTTLPENPSPTSIEAIFRVRRTLEPSLIPFQGPINTTPTLSSSRLNFDCLQSGFKLNEFSCLCICQSINACNSVSYLSTVPTSSNSAAIISTRNLLFQDGWYFFGSYWYHDGFFYCWKRDYFFRLSWYMIYRKEMFS